ncbi:MAG: hypothetical protein JXB88_17755 [Spirochaetales bacterium]|nr:hypothetical protein [Spirochaetales bacterium]
MIRNTSIVTALAFLFFIQTSLPAETIRGPVTEKIMILGEGDFKKQIEMKASDIVLLDLGTNVRFLKGFQIEIVLSDTLKRYSDSFSVELYSQAISASGIEHEGKRILFEVLTFLNNLYVNIPIGNQKIKRESLPPGTFSPAKAVETGHFPLLFTIQPVMKGVPDSVLMKNFYVTLVPDVEKKGILDLSVIKPPGFEETLYKVFIDEDELQKKEDDEYVLNSGIHSLRILSDQFKEETTSFTIESGKTTSVNIQMEISTSVVTMDIIEEASVFIDGERLDLLPGEEKPLATGIHTVVIKIGTQTITKKIDVKSGKRYNISLIFNIEIKEN